MEIAKISDTEVKVIDNKNITNIYTKEEIENTLKILLAQESTILSRRAAKIAMFDNALKPITTDIQYYTALLSVLTT